MPVHPPGPDDPIVFPGLPGASHTHRFFGNDTTHAGSDLASLERGRTSCAPGTDLSSYRVPTLYDGDKEVEPPGTTFSYLGEGVCDDVIRRIQPFPRGLRVVAGNAKATGPQDNTSARRSCLHAGEVNPSRNFVNCPPGTMMESSLDFPQCWNGCRARGGPSAEQGGPPAGIKGCMTAEVPQPVRPATLEDVAAVAGVSRATVSRVINGATTVDPALRTVVEEAVATTGYVPNRAARSLVTRRTDSVALVVSERERRPMSEPFVGRMFSDPYFGRVVSGLLEVLRPAGIQMVVMLADDEASRSQLLSYLRHGHVDGVVLITTHADDPLPGLLQETRMPAVLAGRPHRPSPLAYVEVDQHAGARLAADHLAALGRRRIGTISGPQDMPAGQVRLTGFLEAVAAHGLDDVACAEGDFTHLGGAAAMRRLLADRPDLDGVFIASDLMALGALPVLLRAGRDVPSDVAVVGFDDSSAAAACDPPLTTVRQPVEEMAAEMARLLLKQIGEPRGPSPSVLFPPTLVRRQSA